jgi:hypothetical protein
MRKSQIEKAKKICQNELKMRDYVFRNDYMKRQRKVKEMQYVIDVLNECEKLLPEEQGVLFHLDVDQ